MILTVRVDHRLIHGQVALVWTNSIGANCILVPDNEVVNDKIQKISLKMAAPANVKVVIKNVSDSIKAINSGVTDKYRLFIVSRNVKTAKQLTQNVSGIKDVNLGGVTKKKGSLQITKSVYLTSDERQDVNEMIDNGVSVYAQQVPTDRKEMIKKMEVG